MPPKAGLEVVTFFQLLNLKFTGADWCLLFRPEFRNSITSPAVAD